MTGILTLLELIGTVAFSVSGALVAIGASLDIFGVVFVSCITAVGGGIVRDLLLGIHPPAVFHNFPIVFVAMITAIVVFIVAYWQRNRFHHFKTKTEHINNIFDAIGLAAFSVIGTEVGYTNGFLHNSFVLVAIGMITGIGGGIFRDILTDTTPYVFKKHIYALASIFGSLLYVILRSYSHSVPLASVPAMISVIAIRMLATRYCWELPKISIRAESSEQEETTLQ